MFIDDALREIDINLYIIIINLIFTHLDCLFLRLKIPLLYAALPQKATLCTARRPFVCPSVLQFSLEISKHDVTVVE